MGKTLIKITIAITIVSIIIYIIKNNKSIAELLKRVIEYKYFKIIKKILYVFALILIIFYIYKLFNKVVDSVELYNFTIKNNEMFTECDKKVAEEKEFYNKIINEKYENQNYNNPYLLENFEYVTGEWDTGYVIKDNNGNEFVWVPCTNLENSEVQKLDKSYFCAKTIISKDFCYDLEYKDFLKSALENGGFYISRYEIGNENGNPVSKPNIEIYNNVTQDQAISLSNNMYDSDKFKSELINGYAYDTTLNWMLSTNDNIEKKDIKPEEKYYSKRSDSYNNIFDMFDNILEITMERDYDTVITRGVYAAEAVYEYGFNNPEENRYSITENDSNEQSTFRIVLYK